LQFPVRLVFEISINKSQGSLLSTAEWIWDRHVSLTDNFMLLAQGWVHPRIYLFLLLEMKLKMLFIIKFWVKLIIYWICKTFCFIICILTLLNTSK
jgi:hypothetical protein